MVDALCQNVVLPNSAAETLTHGKSRFTGDLISMPQVYVLP